MIRDTAKRAGIGHAISGQTLFYLALTVSLLLMSAFCLSVLSAANRADRQMVQTVEMQILRILEENGISGLAAAFDAERRVVLPGSDRLELALWQLRGGTRRLILETAPGSAAAFQQGQGHIKVDGISFQITDVDVSTASRDWALPVRDVALVFGVALPTAERKRAIRLITAIVAISTCVCSLMVFLQVVHWQRYRRGLQRINSLLDRYANGETGVRFEDRNPAPELRELGRQLNLVLPRIDGLFADLRALSAHLAHELRTPLQTIRSGLRKVVRENDPALRRGHAQNIDQSIDTADARLHSVMQLFRLQADADVTLMPGVALGDVLEDLVLDFEADLTDHRRTMDTRIEKSVRVLGNVHLLELMISNLLSNAVKYAPEDTLIEVSLMQEDHRFRLSVANMGSLSTELQDHAFDRFTKGSENRGITGYGLGLGLVRAIATRHGFQAHLSQNARSDGAPWVFAVIEGDLEQERDG